MYNPYQQQNMGFNPQQTGIPGNYNPQQQQQPQPQQQAMQNSNLYQQQPLNNQATGYYQQPQFQQQSLYPSQQFQPQQATQIQPQQTGYIQTQPTGFQQVGGGPVPTVVENIVLKIPAIRLSFITAEDQKKFEHLFRTAVPKGETTISGESASNILLRSGLQPVTLAEIWSLSDFNKSGSLLFPEFALALHLCSVAKRGEPLPGILPERWSNEVKSFIDAISFAVPEDPSKVLANTPFANFAPHKPAENDWIQPQTTGYNQQYPNNSFQSQQTGYGQLPLTNQHTGQTQAYPNPTFGAPSLSAQRTGGGTLIPLQPQQTTGLIPAQKTGPQPMQAQLTGYGQNQQTSGYQNQIPMQRTGGAAPLQQQSTGYQNQIPMQRTGGAAPLQQQSTGYQNQMPSQQSGGVQPQITGALQPQPTGRPGEWGFVSMPTGGIPGLSAMQEHFLPNASMSSNNLQNVMGGSQSSNVTDKITKQEKSIYDGIFNAWDTSRKGYIDGDIALNIFTKSGLGRPDLESIWNLADTSDRGKLNIDEFAVAMHLVYRRLNGYELPIRLPPELIPPSHKYLQDSIDTLKDSLRAGKAATQSSNPPKQTKQDGRRFKNDDDNFGYSSNSRHKSKDNAVGSNSGTGLKSTNMSVAELKKSIHEKKILLDAIDAEDNDLSNESKKAETKINDEIGLLKAKIIELEKQIMQNSKNNNSMRDKRQLSKQLNEYTHDKVPSLIKKIHAVNQDIAKRKTELYKLKLLKENPDWAPGNADSDIVGTGPNGEVTESDRRKYKSKQLLKQRMEALTGKVSSSGSNKDLDSKLRQEVEKANNDGKTQSVMINDIESSIRELEEGCAIHLKVSDKEEVNFNKWDKGQGVSPLVAAFINELNSLGNKNHTESFATENNNAQTNSDYKPATQSNQTGSTSASQTYNSAEERSAYIKAQAEKRMNERLAKLGISRHKTATSGFNFQQDSTSSKDPAQPGTKSQQETTKADADNFLKKPDNKPIQKDIAAPVVPDKRKTVEQKQVFPQQPVEVDDEEEEEDPEYAALLKRKLEMEAREKERKIKKQQQREERLAKLKREMDALENKGNDDSSDDDNVDDAPVAHVAPVVVHTGKPTGAPEVVHSATENKITSSKDNAETKEERPVAVTNTAIPETKSYNPFAKPTSEKTPGQQNSFFKATSTKETVDPEKAAAQRVSQRGLSADTEWSDEEVNSSDDDIPSRQGASHLASLLFGGMPSNTIKSSNTPTPKQEMSESDLLAGFASDNVGPNTQNLRTNESENGIQDQPVLQSNEADSENLNSNANAHHNDNDDDSSSDDEWSTPPPGQYGNDELHEGEIQDSPAFEPSANPPPLPNQPPPIPQDLPPPLNFNSDSAPPPPAPPPPPPANGFGAPAPPPPPPPPPPQSNSLAPPAVGAPNINALLGQITGGKSLKKVDKREQRIADGATVGKVL